ncbi:PA3496 family putative envelope integrity protein [Salinicola aestuarinus]|uniref:PA3496 family putative envelope integrity protein n=1 Tax=Salinicola aestuarinus TaxID=1949082 RepID=UPI000DA2069A|nr:hypothetical protein [Salinicola aestuarinus]
MNSIDDLHTLKSEIFDIFMHLEADAHEQRKRRAAVRYLKARRGIERRQETRKLSDEIAELPN